MPITFECKGRRGEKLQATFAHDIDTAKQTVTIDSPNWDYHFAQSLALLTSDNEEEFVTLAKDQFKGKDYYDDSFVYSSQECIEKLSDSIKDQSKQEQVVVQKVFLNALLGFESEFVRQATRLKNEDVTNDVKVATSHLSIDGAMASDILNNIVSDRSNTAVRKSVDEITARLGGQHPNTNFENFDFDL